MSLSSEMKETWSNCQSLLIWPFHQSSICLVCNVLVWSLKICFEFLPLLCPLQKHAWGDLLGSPSPGRALWFWCCSSVALLPILSDGCCQELSMQGLRDFWVSSTQMKIPVLIYCAVILIVRFVFRWVLSLSGVFRYSAVFVLLPNSFKSCFRRNNAA